MPFNQTGLVPDGFQVLNQGVHSGIAPNTLSRQQTAWAVNVTFRNGFAQTRPGWKKVDLKFLDEDGTTDATLQSNFQDGLWQGATSFERNNMLVASIGGRLFAIKIDSESAIDVSIPGDLNRADLRQAWLIEAEDWVIVQDSQAAPIFFNGASSRRADVTLSGGTRELPTGTVMAYIKGRVLVANPTGSAFIIGDIVYGPSADSINPASSILKVTENTLLNGGGAFAIGNNAGKITAASAVGQIDTSNGQGPALIFTERGIFGFNAPVERSVWQDLQYPIQTIAMIDTGATGPYATVLVNGDVWFRAQDGIRSFAVAQRDFGTWVNTPQSFELQRILSRDADNQLQYASGAVFDNRMFMTVSPQQDWDHGTYHLGLAVLDFSPVNSIGAQSQPAWEGVWTGLRVLQLVSGMFDGQQRMFAFALNSSDQIELWELTKDASFDNDGTQELRIQSLIETASFNWKTGWDRLRLEFGDIWYDRIEDRVEFDLDYRPDQEPCWQDWHTWESCSTHETCTTEDPETGCAAVAPQNLQPQYRHRRRFPQPENDVDSITDKPYREGFEFQCRLQWTGACRIKKFRLWASPVTEEAFGSAESDH